MIARIAATVRQGPGALVVTLSIGLLCLIWGSTWLVIREGLTDLPPYTSLAARFLVAGIVFAAFAPTLARVEGGRPPSLRLTLIHGVLILALPYAIIYWVETRLPSGLVSVLWSIFPLLTAVGAHFLLRDERMVPRQWLGLFGGFAGVVLMFATDVAAIGAEAVPAGLILLLSPLVSAVGTNLLKREGSGTSSVLMNRNGMFVSAGLVAVWAVIMEHDAPIHWTPRAIFSVAYLALVGTVIGFGVYMWLLRHAPATRLALIAYCIPVVALTLGATLADEPVGLHTLAGMALILAGVGVVITCRPRRSGAGTLRAPEDSSRP
jgi:drug/metabolite transporter (DMT)-like permease